MKRVFLLFLALIMLFMFIGCGYLKLGCACLGMAESVPYPFWQDSSKITSAAIIIIDKIDYNEGIIYTVLYEAEDVAAFCTAFESLPFVNIVFGDPPTLTEGYAILFSYDDGSLEYVRHYGQERIATDGETYYGWVSCDETSFLSFIGEYITLS